MHTQKGKKTEANNRNDILNATVLLSPCIELTDWGGAYEAKEEKWIYAVNSENAKGRRSAVCTDHVPFLFGRMCQQFHNCQLLRAILILVPLSTDWLMLVRTWQCAKLLDCFHLEKPPCRKIKHFLNSASDRFTEHEPSSSEQWTLFSPIFFFC